MREIRIYQPGHYQVGETFELSPEAGQHVSVVLRLQPGYKLTLFRGDNIEFETVIQTANKKKVTISIIASKELSRESTRAIHLVQALSKGERMEMVVQKSVELGVASLTPVITQHCAFKLDAERLQKKRLQWQAIAIAACEQSGRNCIPIIHPVVSLDDYLEQKPLGLHFVLHPETKKTWRDYSFIEADISLLIGPEGGLSDEEIARLSHHNFSPLSLGPRILRTETASIAALSVLQAVCGDL